jgi:hypothetical protein
MQFTVLALAFAATSVLAAPKADLNARQSAEITIEFYTGDNCQGSPLQTRTFRENSRVCDDPEIGLDGVRTFRVIENTSTTPIRLFNRVDCDVSGQFYEVAPGEIIGQPTCRSQDVKSVRFGPF